MSANHSDSDGSWSLLDEEERHSSSSDFVEVLQGSETVSYHHKDQAVTKATEDNLGQETEGESDKSGKCLKVGVLQSLFLYALLRKLFSCAAMSLLFTHEMD